MKQKLKNKVVVIVGAAGGLGKAYAEAFRNEEACSHHGRAFYSIRRKTQRNLARTGERVVQ